MNFMKKIGTTIILSVLLSIFVKAQSPTGMQVSASIDNGPTPNSVALYIRTLAAFDANKVDNLVFTVRIPKTAGSNITITMPYLAPAFAHLSFQLQKINVDDGVYYYYLINGTGTVQSAAGTVIAANTSFKVAEIAFTGGIVPSAIVQLVDVPNDLPGNSYIRPQFYIQNNLGDFTNIDALFYGTGGAVATNVAGGAGISFVPTAAAVVVPVKFLSFTALKKGLDAELTWTVANEGSLTDRYEVERSVNGIHFTKVSTVAAKLNGNSSNAYTSLDGSIRSLSAEVFFYRIKQVDKDGQVTYSEIRRISQGKNGAVIIYPNPVKDKATLTVDLDTDEFIHVKIFDASGRVMLNSKLNGTKGLNTHYLNMKGYAAGTYNIMINAGNLSKDINLIKVD
jgi:hypothetical protein